MSIRYDINMRYDIGKKLGSIFLFIYLTILIGLRYKVGGDSLTYEMVYESAKDLSAWQFTFMHIYQPGFTFLYAIAKSISHEFYCFQLLHALVLNTMLFIFLWKETKYRFLALAILEYMIYLYFSTEILRESLAVLVFALNYPNYKNKRWINFYIGVFISCLFHISAIVLIFLPLFYNLKFNKHFIWACLGIIVMIPIFNKFFSVFSNNIVADKVDSYLGGSYGILFTFFNVLRGGIFPLFILCLLSKKKHEMRFENMLCVMSLFGLAAAANPLIFGRTVNYFILFLVVTLADYFHSHLRSKIRQIRQNSYIVLLLFFLVYSTQYVHLHQYKRYMPYSSILHPIEYERDHMKFEK